MKGFNASRTRSSMIAAQSASMVGMLREQPSASTVQLPCLASMNRYFVVPYSGRSREAGLSNNTSAHGYLIFAKHLK